MPASSHLRPADIHRIDILLGGLTLLVLGAEFAFVFKPKMRELQETALNLHDLSEELLAQSSELASQQEMLAAQAAQLADSNTLLQRQKEELQELNGRLDESHEVYASAARRMEELFQVIPFACFTFDKDGHISEWNKACESIFGRSVYEVTGQPMGDILAQAMRPEDIDQVLNFPFAGKSLEGLVWQTKDADGDLRWMMSAVYPIHSPGGDVVAAVCSNIDITERTLYQAQLEESMVQLNEYSLELEMQRLELEDANAKLEGLATTDGLTGLRNHRHFQERLEQDMARCKEVGCSLSVILLDVDNFKKFNDSFGHPAGDKVLKAVADVMKGLAPEPFTAARYGGEEFVVVAPGCDEEQALNVAETIRKAIEASEPTGTPVTASFGVATWVPGMRSPTELIAQADKALYGSKANGRNCVTLASSLWLEHKDAA